MVFCDDRAHLSPYLKPGATTLKPCWHNTVCRARFIFEDCSKSRPDGGEQRIHMSFSKFNPTCKHAKTTYLLIISTKQRYYDLGAAINCKRSWVLIAASCPLLAPSSQSNQPRPWPCPPSSSALTKSVPLASKSSSYLVSPLLPTSSW